MATFALSTMTPPLGATFIFGSWVCIANGSGGFGSWVCVANGSGGFDSHLTNSPAPKITTSEDSNKLVGSNDHGIMLLSDLAK